MSEASELPDIDIGEALGASRAASVDRLTVYLPNKDSDENDVADIEDWIEVGMKLLTELNGGATRLPWASGRWRRPDGHIIQERTTVIYSSLMDPENFAQNRQRLRAYLHEFGRNTKQGAVMFDISGVEVDQGEKAEGKSAPRFVVRTYEIVAEEYDAVDEEPAST